MKVENIVVGAGVTGITIAERLASKGEEVLVIEKREGIGGNCYDYFKSGNYVQLYGPHIFHTNEQAVWDYLNRFTKFNNYSHKVFCFVDGKLINIPFNLNSIDLAFESSKAKVIKELLIKEIGKEGKIPVLKLKRHKNPFIRELAEWVYEKIFFNYTVKQWGLKPNEIYASVTARVPIFISEDDRYFQDKWQGIPEKGFTEMFKKMLDNPKIRLILSKDYKKEISKYEYNKLYYTGPLDYFFDNKFGKVKYRFIRLVLEKVKKKSFQMNSVINYPNEEDFTRVTEFNKFLFIENKDTIIAKEYASWDKGFVAYPLQNKENKKIVTKYLKESKKLKNVFFVGRLAECKYYNIDQAVKKGLEITR